MSKVKTIAVFMIKNDTSIQSVRLIKTPQTLAKYLKLYPDNEIKHFPNEDDAVKFIQANNFPIDMKKQKQYMEVSDAKETFNANSKLMKQYKKGKIEEKAPELQKLQDDQGLSFFRNQTKSFYNYYTENQSHIEAAAKKILKGNIYHLMFSGINKTNPGTSGAGFTIIDPEDNMQIYNASMQTGLKTNNQPEYLGLLYGLKTANSLGITRLNVYGDSQLIIDQMNNRFRVKDRNVILYNAECKNMRLLFDHVNFKWIKRDSKEIADQLANNAVNDNKEIGEVAE